MVLRRAAGEHVLAELRPGAEPGGGGADGGQVAQPQGEHLGGVLRLLGAERVGGQQQAGFQPGEPRRHDQPVGGEFQPHAAGALDHREVLLDQRQDGDFRQVHLLRAGEFEQ